MNPLLLVGSTVALALLIVHSWRTRGRAVTLAFFISATAFGMVRGNAIYYLCKLLSENSAAALQPYVSEGGIIPPIGHESVQVAVGWVFALYLAWTISELILKRLPRFAGRVFMITGLASLFMLAVCYVMETTAVAAVWWYWWALPLHTTLFGSVNVPAMEGWFSVVPDFLIPFLVIVCSATQRTWLKWLWLLAFPLHLLGHLMYRWVPYAYLTYNAMELLVVTLMMFSGLRMGRGEIHESDGDRASGAILAAALAIFFGVVTLANVPDGIGAGPEKILTVLPMLMLCLLAWRRLPVAVVTGVSLVGCAGWIWMGPRALWTLAPVAAFAFLVLLDRLREARWLRLAPPVATVALAATCAFLFETDKGRGPLYLEAWVRGDAATFAGAPEDAVAAYDLADRRRPYDLMGFYLAIRAMMEIDPQDPRAASLLFQVRIPRITRELEEVVRRDPEWVLPRQDLARFYLLAGRIPEAREQYRRMNRLRPKDPDTLVMLGYFLLREGKKTDEAEDACERAMRLKDPPAAAMINLGVIRFSRGRDDEARRLWKDALAREPKHPVALLNLERLETGAFYGPIETRFLARTRKGVDMALWVYYLALYGQGYSTDDQLRLYLEATQLDPTLREAHVKLANLYRQRDKPGDRERAAWHARRAEEIAAAARSPQ